MPENNNIKSDELVSVARGQAVVEARQILERDCRVLSVTANATVAVSEVFTGEARYTGKVRFDCITLTENGVECVAAVAEFSDKITSTDIAVGTDVVLVPEIINCEAAADGGALKLVAVVDTSALAVRGNSCACADVSATDGIYADFKQIEYCTVVCEKSETAYVNDSLDNVKANDVLCATARAVVTNVDCADGEVKVAGTVYASVLARCDDGLTSFKLATPFVKSIQAQGAADGSVALANVAVTDAVASLVAAESSRIELAVTLVVDARVFAVCKTEAACDVFCADNEIEAKTAELKTVCIEPQQTVTDIVDGQVKLDPEKPAADNVLCVNGASVTLGGVTVENGRVNVEGLVGGDIVYYNAEKNTTDALAFKLPFSMPLSVHTDAQKADVSAVVTDVNVRVRRESVFDVKAEIAFTVRLSTETTVCVVESVTVGEPIPRPDATVIVHIARAGETLWQAAKALCCSPDRVTEQNDCVAPFVGGERLINFCEK